MKKTLASFSEYKSGGAPCVCVSGPSPDTATHKKAHNAWAGFVSSEATDTSTFDYSDGTSTTDSSLTWEQCQLGAMISVEDIAPHCDPSCVQAQINQQHMGTTEPTDAQNSQKVRRTMDDDHLKTPEDNSSIPG